MNLLEKEKIVKKPWGREIWFAQTDMYMGKILEIGKGEQVSMHLHSEKEETLYLMTGTVEVWGLFTNDQEQYLIQLLSPGESIHIIPNMPHSFKALCDSVLFEVSTPYPEDSVRLKDYYNRPVFNTFNGPDDIADSVKDATKSR